MERYWLASEIAKEKGVTTRAVHLAVEHGILKPDKNFVGGWYRFNDKEVQQYLKRKRGYKRPEKIETAPTPQ